MERIAVIDTETNFSNRVMSIGTVIVDAKTFGVVGMKYHILPKEEAVGGMYSDRLYLPTPVKPIRCGRGEAMEDLRIWLREQGVEKLFAYNASFDRGHLPELGDFAWHDIMAMAAYRGRNPKLPDHWVYCKSGKLKSGYSVERILRLLTGDDGYEETHNAILDALDEMQIMRLMEVSVERYILL